MNEAEVGRPSLMSGSGSQRSEGENLGQIDGDGISSDYEEEEGEDEQYEGDETPDVQKIHFN